jgi:hypothetical protein
MRLDDEDAITHDPLRMRITNLNFTCDICLFASNN